MHPGCERSDKFSEAVTAFSNDFPNHKLPGYLIIGVEDKTRKPVGLHVTDALLQNLAGLRSNGNIQPLPAITVVKYELIGGEVAVVEVIASSLPPLLGFRRESVDFLFGIAFLCR